VLIPIRSAFIRGDFVMIYMSDSESSGFLIEGCTKCSELCESRSRIVNGVGDMDADVVFVGEAPGKNEDVEGEPFVGRSGSVLDDAVEKAGGSREDVRITNLVRCRPPENRDPLDSEVANCSEYLREELHAVEPEYVVPLGRIPCSYFVEDSFNITEVAGDVVEFDGFDVVLCMHPAATIYNRELRPVFTDIIDNVIN